MNEKLIARIRALKAKTPGRGCTEAEAIAAAEKAAALMAEHAISEDVLAMDERVETVKVSLKSSRARIWGAISHCTNCVILHTAARHEKRLHFIGIEPGPEIAQYLREVCDRAIDRAISDFKKGKFYKARRSMATKRAAVDDFANGMVSNLSWRLIDMFSASISDERKDKASAAFDKMYPGTASLKRKAHTERFGAAGMAGHMAADRVNLAHAVNGGSKPAMIGGAR